MVYLYLNFKCPHCNHLNLNVSENGNTTSSFSRNTGEQQPQQHNEPVLFHCGGCGQASAWEIDLKLL